MVEPKPEFKDKEFRPFDCLTSADFVEQCTRPMSVGEVEMEIVRSQTDNSRSIFSISFNDLICKNLDACPALIDGIAVIRDKTHLTVDYSEAIYRDIDDRLVAQGALEEWPN